MTVFQARIWTSLGIPQMPLHPAWKGTSFPLLTSLGTSSVTVGQEATEQQQELEGPTAIKERPKVVTGVGSQLVSLFYIKNGAFLIYGVISMKWLNRVTSCVSLNISFLIKCSGCISAQDACESSVNGDYGCFSLRYILGYKIRNCIVRIICFRIGIIQV